MSSTTPGQVGSPEPMSTTSTRPSKRSLESPEQQNRGEGQDDRTKRRRSDEDVSVGRPEQRIASSSRSLSGASAMERGIREMELQDQQPDRTPVGNGAEQRTTVDHDAFASELDMDVDEPHASSSAAQLSTASQPRFGIRPSAIASFDRSGTQSTSSPDDGWVTPDEIPQNPQARARSPPSTEEVRTELARAQNFSDTIAPLRRSLSPHPVPQPERHTGQFGDFISLLRPTLRDLTPSSFTRPLIFPQDTFAEMGVATPSALPDRHPPLSLSLPRSQNSSRSSGTVLQRLGTSERLSQVPTSPPQSQFETNWLRHPSLGGPSMLPAGQAGVRHEPPPAPHSPLLHPSLHTPPLVRSVPSIPDIGRFSFPNSPDPSLHSSPASNESDIAPTVFPSPPYRTWPDFRPLSPAPRLSLNGEPLLRENDRLRHSQSFDPTVPAQGLFPTFSRARRDHGGPQDPPQQGSLRVAIPDSYVTSQNNDMETSMSRGTQTARSEASDLQVRLPPIRTRGPLPGVSSVVAGLPENAARSASNDEGNANGPSNGESSRQILENLIRMRDSGPNASRQGTSGAEILSETRHEPRMPEQQQQDQQLYWSSGRERQPETSNVRQETARQRVQQSSTRRDRAAQRIPMPIPMPTARNNATQLPSLDALNDLPSTRLMPPPNGSPSSPWSIWRTMDPEILRRDRPHQAQILELSQLLNEVQESTEHVESGIRRTMTGTEDVPLIRVDAPPTTMDQDVSRAGRQHIQQLFSRENSLGLEMNNPSQTRAAASRAVAPPFPRPITPMSRDLTVNREPSSSRERMTEALDALYRDRLEIEERIITARRAGLTTAPLEEAARFLRQASNALQGAITVEARAQQILTTHAVPAAPAPPIRPPASRREASDEQRQAEFIRLMSETEPLLAEHRRTDAAIRQLVTEGPSNNQIASAFNAVPSIPPTGWSADDLAARDARQQAELMLQIYRREDALQFSRERIVGPEAGRDTGLRRRLPAYAPPSDEREANVRPVGPSGATPPSLPPVPPRPSPSSRYDPVRDIDQNGHNERTRPRMRAVPLTPLRTDPAFYSPRNVVSFRQQIRSRERPNSFAAATSSQPIGQTNIIRHQPSALSAPVEPVSARSAALQEQLRNRSVSLETSLQDRDRRTGSLEPSLQERERRYIRSRLSRWDDSFSSRGDDRPSSSLFAGSLVTDDDMDIISDSEAFTTATSAARRSNPVLPIPEPQRERATQNEIYREHLRRRREERRNYDQTLRQRHRPRPEESEDSEAHDRRIRSYESSWGGLLADRVAHQGQTGTSSRPRPRPSASVSNLSLPSLASNRPTPIPPPRESDPMLAELARDTEPRDRLNRLLYRTGRGSSDNQTDVWSTFHPAGPGWRYRSRLADYISDSDMSYESLLRLSDRIGSHPRGATPETISRLRTNLYRNEPEAGENKHCTICLEEYGQDDTVMHLDSCPHWFHKDCIETWLSRARTCPCCRATIGQGSSSRSTAGPSEARGIGGFFAILNRPRRQTGTTSQQEVPLPPPQEPHHLLQQVHQRQQATIQHAQAQPQQQQQQQSQQPQSNFNTAPAPVALEPRSLAHPGYVGSWDAAYASSSLNPWMQDDTSIFERPLPPLPNAPADEAPSPAQPRNPPTSYVRGQREPATVGEVQPQPVQQAQERQRSRTRSVGTTRLHDESSDDDRDSYDMYLHFENDEHETDMS